MKIGAAPFLVLPTLSIFFQTFEWRRIRITIIKIPDVCSYINGRQKRFRCSAHRGFPFKVPRQTDCLPGTAIDSRLKKEAFRRSLNLLSFEQVSTDVFLPQLLLPFLRPSRALRRPSPNRD